MVHAIVHPIRPYCGFEDGGDELISLTPIDLEDCHGEIVLERYIMMIYITYVVQPMLAVQRLHFFLKLFFCSLSAFIMALSDDFPVAFLTNMGGGYAVLFPIDCTTTYLTGSLSKRMNKFHSFSSPMVDNPVVILFSFTIVSSRWSASFSGSTCLAKARLSEVYS